MTIELNEVSKYFKNTTVINDVTMVLRSGNVYGIQGINGSGKTMLMRLIAGLIRPSKGTVSIDGQLIKSVNSFPGNIGILIENPSFLNRYSGFNNLKLLADITKRINTEQIINSLCRVGLDPTDKKKYRKYSLGMKQRLGIACAIMEKPELLILDEPINSLDEDAIKLVLKIIRDEKERGSLIIIACHDHEILFEICDELFRIVAGKITRHSIKTSIGTFTETNK